jgi:transcription elongation factor GreA
MAIDWTRPRLGVFRFYRVAYASRQELEELTTTGRREIAERLRHATSAEANAEESVDYQDVREDQALLERRIALLEERIASAQVVDPDAANGVVDVGERVTVRDVETGEQLEYELVGSFEGDPASGRVSSLSPLGRALLGRAPGEIAVVEAPKGAWRLEVVAIEVAADGELAAAP